MKKLILLFFGAILKFKEVGVILTINDFVYSKYVKEYISLFLDGINRKRLDMSAIQEKFETIYWKVPDIITHIELNLRYLYIKYKKQIDKYYADKEKYIISSMSTNVIFSRYNKLLKDKDHIIQNDSYRIIHNFLDGKIAPLDYTKKSINDNYAKYMSEIFLESILDSSKQDDLDLNLIKLKNAAYEYKQILKYNYVIEDIKARYEENKENAKSLKSEEQKMLKDIAKDEKKVIAFTKKSEKTRFNKSNDEALHVKQNNIIRELKNKYREYDRLRINNIILENINEASMIEDVFKIASSFYRELFSKTKEIFPEMSEDDLDDTVQGLKDFVHWPYNILTNNSNIYEDKNLLYVIKDRYSLMNINISEEMLEPSSLDALIDDLSKFEQYYYIRKNNINIEKIIDFVNLKTLIDRVEKQKAEKKAEKTT